MSASVAHLRHVSEVVAPVSLVQIVKHLGRVLSVYQELLGELLVHQVVLLLPQQRSLLAGVATAVKEFA
jgi:hypothetical protein